MEFEISERAQLMVGAGYGDQDVRNVLGENYMCVCGTVWK